MNNRSALTILSLAALLTFTGCSKPNGVAPANESAKSERSGSMSRAKAASLIMILSLSEPKKLRREKTLGKMTSIHQ